MWPIPSIQNEHVTISFTENNLVCCWIQYNKKTLETRLIAYERTPFEQQEIDHLMLFNPTRIRTLITSFLHKYHLNNAFISFILDGQGVIENFVSLSTPTPKQEQFNVTKTSNSIWNYTYVYQNDTGQFVFYTYKIPQSVVLQYKLLAIAAKCNLVAYTTHTTVLLNYYKHIHGPSFRTSQFALDMMNNDNNILSVISHDNKQPHITVPHSIIFEKEKEYITPCYGAFISQRICA